MASLQKHPLGYDSKVAILPSGHHLRYVDIHPPQGTKTIVTALLIHGFPDSAYGWRHQVKGWSARGIRLIIPDTIGYTGSSQPFDPEEYAFKYQSDDLEALVRIASVPENEKIAVIAHDWGAITGTRLSQFKPDFVQGIVLLCVPPILPPLKYMSLEELVALYPNFEYQLFFASAESAALLDSNVEKFMNLIYVSAKQIASGEAPSWEKKGVFERYIKDSAQSVTSELLSKEELNTMVSEIKAGVGFRAMLNYYRTGKINFPLEKDLPRDYRPDMPKLLVVPTADPAIPLSMSANVEKDFKRIEVVKLEGLCGHWVQLERPEEVERVVGEWVEKQAGKGWIVEG